MTERHAPECRCSVCKARIAAQAPQPVLAFVSDPGSRQWVATTDLEAITDRTPEHVILLSSPDDQDITTAELLAKFPVSDHRLTRVQRTPWPIKYNSTFEVLPYEYYLGRDGAELADIVRLVGKPVRVNQPPYRDIREQSYGNQRDNLHAGGAYIRMVLERVAPGQYESEVYYAVYDPRVAKRRMARKPREEKPQPMRTYLIGNAVHGIAEHLQVLPRLLGHRGYNIKLGDSFEAAQLLMELIALFDLIYGRHAHRQVKGFQDLLAAWRPVKAVTRTKYIQRYKGFVTFCDWIELELRSRPVKVREEFKPRAGKDKFLVLDRFHPQAIIRRYQKKQEDKHAPGPGSS